MAFYSNGGVLLATATRQIEPDQRVAILKALPSGTAGAFAVVELTGESGALLASASVVDDSSKDPTTIPMTVVTAP